MTDRYPRRIACLTEETCETLYLLGEQARKEKPKVAALAFGPGRASHGRQQRFSG